LTRITHITIRHLIDADPQQPVEPLAVQLFPDDPLHDAIDGPSYS